MFNEIPNGKPVVVVQHEPFVPPGSILETLQSDKIDHDIIEAWRETVWPSAEDLGSLIVLGGTMNVEESDSYPFLAGTAELVAAALEREVPTLGVCLGAQMMAKALGAKVFPAESRNATFSSLHLSDEGRLDPVLAPFASGTPVLQFHEDTFTLPDGSVLIAKSSSSGLTQAFRYGLSSYAVQFHFEVDREIIETWCGRIGPRKLEAEWGTSKEDLLVQADRYLDAQREGGKELLRLFLSNHRILSAAASG